MEMEISFVSLFDEQMWHAEYQAFGTWVCRFGKDMGIHLEPMGQFNLQSLPT